MPLDGLRLLRAAARVAGRVAIPTALASATVLACDHLWTPVVDLLRAERPRFVYLGSYADEAEELIVSADGSGDLVVPGGRWTGSLAVTPAGDARWTLERRDLDGTIDVPGDDEADALLGDLPICDETCARLAWHGDAARIEPGDPGGAGPCEAGLMPHGNHLWNLDFSCGRRHGTREIGPSPIPSVLFVGRQARLVIGETAVVRAVSAAGAAVTLGGRVVGRAEISAAEVPLNLGPLQVTLSRQARRVLLWTRAFAVPSTVAFDRSPLRGTAWFAAPVAGTAVDLTAAGGPLPTRTARTLALPSAIPDGLLGVLRRDDAGFVLAGAPPGACVATPSRWPPAAPCEEADSGARADLALPPGSMVCAGGQCHGIDPGPSMTAAASLRWRGWGWLVPALALGAAFRPVSDLRGLAISSLLLASWIVLSSIGVATQSACMLSNALIGNPGMLGLVVDLQSAGRVLVTGLVARTAAGGWWAIGWVAGGLATEWCLARSSGAGLGGAAWVVGLILVIVSAPRVERWLSGAPARAARGLAEGAVRGLSRLPRGLQPSAAAWLPLGLFFVALAGSTLATALLSGRQRLVDLMVLVVAPMLAIVTGVATHASVREGDADRAPRTRVVPRILFMLLATAVAMATAFLSTQDAGTLMALAIGTAIFLSVAFQRPTARGSGLLGPILVVATTLLLGGIALGPWLAGERLERALFDVHGRSGERVELLQRAWRAPAASQLLRASWMMREPDEGGFDGVRFVDNMHSDLALATAVQIGVTRASRPVLLLQALVVLASGLHLAGRRIRVRVAAATTAVVVAGLAFAGGPASTLAPFVVPAWALATTAARVQLAWRSRIALGPAALTGTALGRAALTFVPLAVSCLLVGFILTISMGLAGRILFTGLVAPFVAYGGTALAVWTLLFAACVAVSARFTADDAGGDA